MSVVVPEQCAISASAAPGSLFVATSLHVWSTGEPDQFARDFQINDTVYRRLDPEYYAWLRSRMVLAKKAATAGHLDATPFEDLRLRFNAVHDWAVDRFGEAPLLAAVRTLRAGDYKPPVAEDEGPRVPVPRVRKSAADTISPETLALVDAISEQALSFGWRRDRLYGIGPQRGIVCFLKPNDRIGEVAAQVIEIVRPLPSEVRHRFYNPDVEQPWMTKIGAPQ